MFTVVDITKVVWYFRNYFRIHLGQVRLNFSLELREVSALLAEPTGNFLLYLALPETGSYFLPQPFGGDV